MNFTDAVKAVFKKYAVFEGRSLRSEYWYFVLFCFLVGIVLSIIDSVAFGTSTSSSGPLELAFSLATLVPSIAVGVRRLHDIDRSGWWLLLAFTIVGIVVLIYWAVQPGTPGKNRFGDAAPTKP